MTSRGGTWEALTLCADVNNATWFADITEYWARTVNDEFAPTALVTAQRVRDGSLATKDALAVVLGGD